MKHINLLREMQYERLRMTRRFREMQRMAHLPGIDLSAPLSYLAKLTQPQKVDNLFTVSHKHPTEEGRILKFVFRRETLQRCLEKFTQPQKGDHK